MDSLPTPSRESLIYQDDKLYCCLATYPLTKGHWHLIPRYNEKGYDVLLHQPVENHDFSLAPIIKKELTA